ncbi:hypothetical protein [uncultured Flavobacterium sp.]|uniref:hypothetical protein n=1 Tax=uncultured Flavobacterium sp. TaxID=165435 RepID=UPI0030EB1CF1|tara:strand:+ start:1631 stop:2395 length:765 start_codon:yes stop_codon:yes gene_type:complete
MEEIICYTFNEFKNKYYTLLETFLNEWEDNSEKDFLTNQKQLYKECINNTSIKHREDLSIEQLEFFNVEPLSNSFKCIQSKISESVFYYWHPYMDEMPLYHDTFRLRVKDIDLCDKYNRSFNMILEFIQNKTQEIENNLIPLQAEGGTETVQPKMSLEIIALKYVYENKCINISNHNEIANKYRHNSGKKLLQYYTFYYDRNNRKAKPHPSYTRLTLNNKIKKFEKVIALLSNESKSKAIDELKILQGFLIDFE